MGGDADRARSVAAVILAAGASSRYGRPKQLLHYRGRSLLRRAAEAVAGSRCCPIVVILGASATACANELRGLPVHPTESAVWMEGMGGSLRTGIETVCALAPGAAAAVVTLCDQPHVSSQIIDALVQRHRESGAPVVASAYAGTLGVPALFDRSLFGELLALRGDGGARRIIERFRRGVEAVPFPAGIVDIDTPQDFVVLQESGASSDPAPEKGG
jgi:molybdenum cofactor cytidylyltransferase